MLTEVPESTQRHTNVRLKQIELALFTLCDESFVFCDVAAEISAQVPGPRLRYDVRLQGLHVEHANQSLACETAINADFSELLSLKRIYVKYEIANLSLMYCFFRT